MAKTLAEKLMSQLTDRDRQVKIGPSSIGDPCDKCVADILKASKDPSATASPPGKYWLGAKNGTAIHAYLENLVIDLNERMGEVFLVPEQKITIGELKGYGLIKGTGDGILVPGNSYWPVDVYTVVDYKTTTRDKLVWLQQAFNHEPEPDERAALANARYKVQTYYGQTQLYAWGLRQGGVPVEAIQIEFICRDGKTSDDFWSVSFAYEEAYVKQVWKRLENIWKNLDKKVWKSHPLCYSCNTASY